MDKDTDTYSAKVKRLEAELAVVERDLMEAQQHLRRRQVRRQQLLRQLLLLRQPELPGIPAYQKI